MEETVDAKGLSIRLNSRRGKAREIYRRWARCPWCLDQAIDWGMTRAEISDINYRISLNKRAGRGS